MTWKVIRHTDWALTMLFGGPIHSYHMDKSRATTWKPEFAQKCWVNLELGGGRI